ncbi:60S ribosomal protein [Musa troglodytarum]|uniref:60S ribosomal protein n=1 Tax=Musa troglodytarum TaxID=320322 RepID=A0A9E7H8P8_9LILI|nr:60S ribosomal protein [Musa troglodytarum]
MKGGFYVSPEAKLLFIIRFRGMLCTQKHEKSCSSFDSDSVFLKVNKATMNMLQRVEPYGIDLQEGKLKVEQAETDNSIIKQGLWKYGIICIEDVAHEIMIVGPHFKQANNFFWPFKLKAPLGGLKMKRNHYVKGGDAGNREDYIHELSRRMN